MGGGQPCDHGTLLIPSHSLSFQVLDSSNVDGVCVLTAYSQDPEVPADAASLAGQPCKMGVDFDRRMDHMQQHTGQHVISAIALDKFKVRKKG
jgi:Ser-tRNA(Ala) deacylase AlaX